MKSHSHVLLKKKKRKLGAVVIISDSFFLCYSTSVKPELEDSVMNRLPQIPPAVLIKFSYATGSKQHFCQYFEPPLLQCQC